MYVEGLGNDTALAMIQQVLCFALEKGNITSGFYNIGEAITSGFYNITNNFSNFPNPSWSNCS